MSQAPKWITPTGSVGAFEQGQPATIVFTTVGATDFTFLTGEQPGYFNFHITTGTSITDVTTLEVIGTPYFYAQDHTAEFVLRASNDYGVNDRTFSITVTGHQGPVWETPADYLQVGPNLEPYALNKNRVDYLLQANIIGLTDANGNQTTQTLRYFIGENDGQLPPGLTLNENTGVISGYVDDLLTLDFLASKIGGFDGETYDSYPYDHAVIIQNNNQGAPAAVTKVYSFYVSVTNGITTVKRRFRIRVEDPSIFRADTTQITDDTTDFLSGIGYLIPPVWQNNDKSLLPSPSTLGTIRANTEQVINLKTYDPYPFVGPVTFDWDLIKVNPEVAMLSTSINDQLDQATVNLVGNNYIVVSRAVGVPTIGMKIQLNSYVAGATSDIYTVTRVNPFDSGYRLTLDQPLLNNIPNQTTIYAGSLCAKPPGLSLEPDQGILYGRLPFQPAYSKNYRFTIRITKTDQDTGVSVSNNHIFNLTLKGDVETSINFTSPTNLGTLLPGHVSDLTVEAAHTVGSLSLTYSLTGGSLPPGLKLTSEGNITGIVPVNIPANPPGKETIDPANHLFEIVDGTTFDNDSTTFDRTFTFNVTVLDSYLLSAVSKDFTITVQRVELIPYTNIYVKPFLTPTQRLAFKSIVSNSQVFDSSLLYRSDDPFFGVQQQIKMVIEYGVEKLNLDNYVPALTNYFKRRRYYFGQVKTVTAVDVNGKQLYDAVYVDMIDNQMLDNKYSVGKSFTQTINGQVVTYYPDSVTNEQYALETLNISNTTQIRVDSQLRPLFMQSLQMDSGIPLGFVKAVILCYAKPGKGINIVNNINNSGFDFKALDFDVDRIVVEETSDGVAGPKYLVFGSAGASSGFFIDTEDDQDIITEDGANLTL